MRNILKIFSGTAQRAKSRKECFSVFRDKLRTGIRKMPFIRGEGVLPAVNVFLAALALALFIYLVLIMLKPYRIIIAPDRQQALATSDSRYLDVLKTAGVGEVDPQVFYNRELFPRGPAKAQPVKKKQTSLFEILGIVSVAGEKAAMIRSLETGREYYCLEGDVIGDYTVTSILDDRVIFKSATNTVEVTR